MNRRKKRKDPYDLCACYEPDISFPAEYQDPDDWIPKYYFTDDTGTYFVYGDTTIKVKENFADDGKQIGNLIEDAIRYSAQKRS